MPTQFIRFSFVGVVNTITALSVIWVLHEQLALSVWLSSGLGYAVATVQSYLLNQRWTFANATTRPTAQQFIAFVVVSIICGCLFSIINSYFEKRFDLVISTILAIAVTYPINFLLNRSFVFKINSRTSGY
jgi:putative flippase GtrA